MRSPLVSLRHLLLAVAVFLALTVAAGAGTHSSAVPIALTEDPNGPGPAVPYPSTIAVSGETVVGDVNATLSLITDEFPDDLDVLLVGPGPNGQKVILMADAGTGLDAGAVTGVTITLDDEALTFLPDESQITDGSYKPSVYGVTPDCDGIEPEPEFWPSPAPDPPYSQVLSAFDGTVANGTWSLYVVDDCFLFTPGVIAGGWSLTITAPSAVRLADLRAELGKRSVVVRWRTAAEAGVLGFNVYRSSGTATMKLNRTLIQAKAAGRAAGARYILVDRRVRADTSYTYRLQVVDLSGKRSWAGSVSTKTPR